jgi:hypothetical protein
MIEKFSEEWLEKIEDKNSPEWKEYCEGLLEFDSCFSKEIPYTVPYYGESPFEEDWVGYRNYVNKHYDGDSSKMTPHETALFFKLKENKRKTA